jgi:hypothetical protein
MDDLEIGPFRLISHDSGNSLILNVGDYKTEIFEKRKNEGFEGNGYDWESLAKVFLNEKLLDLKDKIGFDSEGSMFCTYSKDLKALKKFAVAFYNACENKVLIEDLFSRAELD